MSQRRTDSSAIGKASGKMNKFDKEIATSLAKAQKLMDTEQFEECKKIIHVTCLTIIGIQNNIFRVPMAIQLGKVFGREVDRATAVNMVNELVSPYEKYDKPLVVLSPIILIRPITTDITEIVGWKLAAIFAADAKTATV